MDVHGHTHSHINTNHTHTAFSALCWENSRGTYIFTTVYTTLSVPICFLPLKFCLSHFRQVKYKYLYTKRPTTWSLILNIFTFACICSRIVVLICSTGRWFLYMEKSGSDCNDSHEFYCKYWQWAKIEEIAFFLQTYKKWLKQEVGK